MEKGYRKVRLRVRISRGILGEEGNLLPQARRGREGVFSFDDPIISISRTHTMGKKPPEGTYRPRPLGAGDIDQADGLTFAEHQKIGTGRADPWFLPTISRGAAAAISADFELLPMAREALSGLRAKGLLTDKAGGGQLHGSRSLDGLQALFEEHIAEVTPAVMRSRVGAARGRLTEQPAQVPMPLVTQSTPSALPSLSPVYPAENVQPQSKSQPQLRRRASSAEYSEYPGPLPTMVDQVAEVLRDTPRLVQRQREDARLGPIWGRLRGRGDRQSPEGTANYVLDGNDLLWSVPRGETPKLAIPRALVPGVLALVLSTYGHPGVARTLLLNKGEYGWPTVAQDVREYVLSCVCRRRK